MDLEGCGRMNFGLFSVTVRIFLEALLGKLRKISVRIVGLRVRFKPGTSRIRSRDSNHSTELFNFNKALDLFRS